MGCQFCFSSGKSVEQCLSHRLRAPNGLVSCPVLRSVVCPICSATGDYAHTQSYCPLVTLDHSKTKEKKVGGRFSRSLHTGALPAAPPVQDPAMMLLVRHQQYKEYYR